MSPASSLVLTCFKSWLALLVAPSLPPRLPSYLTPSTPFRHLQLPSTPLDVTSLPIWPPGPLSRHGALVSSTCSFSRLLGCMSSYPAWSTMFELSQSPLMPFDAFGSPIWPLGPLLRHNAFVSLTRSFASFLGRSRWVCELSGTTASLSGSSSSGQGLPGAPSSSFRSECLRSSSDALRSFFGSFPASSTSSEAPRMSTSPLVRSTPQLVAAIFSPSSSTLRDSVRHSAGLSGGFGGSGKSFDSFASRSRH